MGGWMSGGGGGGERIGWNRGDLTVLIMRAASNPRRESISGSPYEEFHSPREDVQRRGVDRASHVDVHRGRIAGGGGGTRHPRYLHVPATRAVRAR